MAYEDRIMRMAGSVPQRTVQRSRPDNIGYDRAGGDDVTPEQAHISSYRPRRDTPIQSGGRQGEFSDRLYSGRNPFIQPIQTGGRQGEFPPGIFGGRNPRAFAANDTVNALMGGMNRNRLSGQEQQMAELLQGQKDYMGKRINTPDFGNVTKEGMWGNVQGMTEEPGYWWNPLGAEGQEPPTKEEFEDYYRQLELGNVGSWQT